MAGLEGFEPPTRGFGVRCSTVRATGLRGGPPPSAAPGVTPARRASLCLPMGGMLPAPGTVLGQLQAVGGVPLVLPGRVIPSLTLAAGEVDRISHGSFAAGPSPGSSGRASWLWFRGHSLRGYARTSLTTPAPTVRPPSRMAKRSSFSMAMGWMSSTVTVALSPGMTISVPSGSCTTPVTSVVRK